MRNIVVATILWGFLYTIFIPSCGKKIDKLCVKGRVAREAVVSTNGFPGTVLVEVGDRIIRRECSEMMRKVTFRDEYEAVLDYINQ